MRLPENIRQKIQRFETRYPDWAAAGSPQPSQQSTGYIKTEGLQDKDPTTTYPDHTDTPGSWVRRHSEDVDDDTPSGDTLCTTWTIDSQGTEKKVTTDRAPGTPDSTFLLLHMAEYLDEMFGCPPVA